ncbi:D-2-hydroxyacid dehydrogenase [Photobacterium nomapromontoriensis]|uniref:D-2-hydroxyacid dehydrogenase n=1 Tax=Photobacterium nomapromontoriensis TaxID=2910237 RepID=UPI003D0DE0C4
MHNVMVVSRQRDFYESLLLDATLPNLNITADPAQATIILADPPLILPLIDQFPRLHWLQSTFAGIDALIQPNLRQDYLLTNIKGCFGQLISEYVLGLLLEHTRHFPDYHRQQTQCQWHAHPYSSLVNKRMVILGTGSIGSHLARSARALGMHVTGVNRSGQSSATEFDQIFAITELPLALSLADVVVSTLPATRDTDDLLNQQTLSHCRDSLLFNVGRGNAVCESGLLHALAQGAIRHAFLDVFKQEPLPANHPFWRHPSITITPHIAAESFPEQVMAIFTDNYLHWINNQPLRYTVDFSRGY